MNCSNCGNFNNEGTTICIKCGQQLIKESNKVKSRKKINIFIVLTSIVIAIAVASGIFISNKKNNNKNAIYCTFDGELVKGIEYVNGQYTYRYMQEGNTTNNWFNMEEEGWGVVLTDKESSKPVTTKLCTYINNKPIVSMRAMFSDSNAISLDLSSFNTSKVKDMRYMFFNSKAEELDLSSFDISNVEDMGLMFSVSKATTGYAKNQKDADKFNSSSYKVSTLNFIVKK